MPTNTVANKTRAVWIVVAAVVVVGAVAGAWRFVAQDERARREQAERPAEEGVSARPGFGESVRFEYAPRAEDGFPVLLEGEVAVTRRRHAFAVVSVRGRVRLAETGASAQSAAIEELYAVLARPAGAGWEVAARSAALPVGERLTAEDNEILLAMMRFEIPLDDVASLEHTWIAIAATDGETTWYAHGPREAGLADLKPP